VTFRPLDCDPVPTVSIVVAWKHGNQSRLLREFVKLVRQCCDPRKDAAGLKGLPTKS
jgi:hypothetical protein